ncbi:MAG: 50S ribosomal protein L11 methyltransferase [Kofleriaceae bacterium]
MAAADVPVTDWIEVVVPATAASVDELSALLVAEVAAAAAGTEVRGDEIVFWAPQPAQEAAVAEARAAVARWAEAGAELDPARVRSQPAVPEAEWRDAWKRYFHVSRLTRQLVVVPSWEAFTPGDDDRVIALDPGMAFGTGTHASTRLVLAELQRLADDGVRPDRVLDVGAGSGILAIAAALLWPTATVVATDNDPIAVAACAENTAANGVGDRITSVATPLAEVGGTWPLVLANIQAHVLRALKAELVAACAPGATLVLSGLLTPQAQPLADEFVAAGLVQVAVRPSPDDPQWSSVVLGRAP